jgi:nucleolar MIF4G domain-containing protein 1
MHIGGFLPRHDWQMSDKLVSFSQIFSAVLMYDILERLNEKFGEKEVELILLILRSVGFSLRKDDPLALKELILKLQQKAGEASQFKSR